MNYIDEILSDNINKKDVVQYFFLDYLTGEDLKKYDEDSLERTARYLINILEETSIGEIVDTIEKNSDKIKKITTANIPQFSSLDAVDKVLEIVESNPGCDFELIGYFFNKDGSKGAQVKYGENHYKVAALLNLVTWEQPHRITNLGKEYLRVDQDKRKIIRSKLYLLIPLIQRAVIKAKYEKVNMMDMLREYLAESTAIRRRSNVKLMIEYICELDDELTVVETNLKWK